MSPEALALLAALIGGLITATGWFVNHLLFRRNILRQSQREAALRRLRMQIEDLYGPLSGLIQQSLSVYGVAKWVLPTTDGKLDMGRFSDADWKAWRYLCERYFFPVNHEISALLKTKLFLLETGQMPETFNKFFEHAAHFEVRHSMWRDTGYDTSSKPGPGWPEDFGNDILQSLQRLNRKFFELTGAQTASLHKTAAADK
jgi:hypothetical protein